MESDGFTLVTLSSKRSRGRRKVFRASMRDTMHRRVAGSDFNVKRQLSHDEVVAEAARIGKRLTALRKNFTDQYIQRVCHALRQLLGDRKFAAIRILGIGSFGFSLAPAFQLILAECIREHFAVSDISSQEPILSHEEVYFLHQRNIRTPSVDDKSALLAANREDGVTLFYMIHCEHFMYDDVLRANWHADALRNMIIIGNDFRGYSTLPIYELVALRAFASVCRQMEVSIPLEPYAFSDTCIVYLDEDAPHEIPVLPAIQ